MAIPGDPVTNPFKAGELFGDDVDQFARSGELVPTHPLDWLQVLEPAETQGP